MRPLVLLFGSPELFIIAIMGITFIGTLAGASLIKGLLAGGLGLMLAAIGVDPQTGSLRYTFGSLYLWDRLDLIPVVVGMFAIPEIVDLAVRGTSIASGKPDKLTGVMEGVKDTFRHFWLVVRCSLIGVYFGVLPVLGANVAQWISYAHAVQGLKDKSRAGKGAVEGLLGPGAANNSTRGGDLIPTLAFGIPGSGAMALLLGAMLIVGLNPGPEMLKSRLDVTFSMVWVLILSNIIVAAAMLLDTKSSGGIDFYPRLAADTLSFVPRVHWLVYGQQRSLRHCRDSPFRLYRLLHGQVRLAAAATDSRAYPR